MVSGQFLQNVIYNYSTESVGAVNQKPAGGAERKPDVNTIKPDNVQVHIKVLYHNNPRRVIPRPC